MVFREVIRPPLWVLAFIYFLFLSLVIAIWAALDNRCALISWIAATLGIKESAPRSLLMKKSYVSEALI